jgi:hypothetical protein
MRARADAKNAPAEPTTARIAVGFSGEVTQPLCAWSGKVTQNKRAVAASQNVDFVIGVSVLSCNVTSGGNESQWIPIMKMRCLNGPLVLVPEEKFCEFLGGNAGWSAAEVCRLGARKDVGRT